VQSGNAEISLKKRRTSALRIRITPDERVALDAAAAHAGVGPCSLARVLVVTAIGQTPTPAPRRRRKPSQAARDMAKAIAEIARVGNNLNQLAHAANRGFDLDPAIVEEATNELRRLREAIIASRDDSASS
jgi:Bacterial mobilisation protein (MobC)